MSESELCEDCGVPLDRHGAECGYYADQAYGNPEYGRPAGWLDPSTGRITPVDGPRRACLACGAGLTLTEAWRLGDSPRRCWIYRCVAEGCRAEHVFYADRGGPFGSLHQLAADDDSTIDGERLDLAEAGDPL